jgi:ABC-type Fe3+-hydroxamate transport system substrate-binding protein
MSPRLTDATGVTLDLDQPARRIVSLVPSETETVALLGAASSLVGRTSYCVEPRGALKSVESVGGTKDADTQAVVALRPDLVLANQEENTQDIVDHLRDAGLTVHVSFPKTVEQAVALVRDIATLLGISREHDAIREMDGALARAHEHRSRTVPVRVFCPIWMDPLMTIHGDTFISDMLDLAGGANVFAERARRYPLAADLGQRPALSPDRVQGRDTRYPRITWDELVAAAPDVILLPDEPHPFTEADADRFRALETPASKNGQVYFIDGKDLCWYSPRMGAGVHRVSAWFDRVRTAM